jgi:hypothetical protein
MHLKRLNLAKFAWKHKKVVQTSCGLSQQSSGKNRPRSGFPRRPAGHFWNRYRLVLELAWADFGCPRCFFWKLSWSCGKFVNCVWKRFSTEIISPLYLYERITTSSEIHLSNKKFNLLLFLPFLLPQAIPTLYCPTLLSTRCSGAVGDLVNPREFSLCSSQMGLLGRRSWVFRAKNEHQIGLVEIC